MSDLMQGTSAYEVGGIDTSTVLVNGVSSRAAEHINGPAAAIVQVERVLGSALTLKGTLADLAARLAVALGSTGTLNSGLVVPSPTITNPIITGVISGAHTYSPLQLGTLTAGTPNVINPYNGNSTNTTAHGLGTTPAFATMILENITANVGYSPGDKILLSSAFFGDQSTADMGISIVLDATNTVVIIGLTAIFIINKSTRGLSSISVNNWKLTVTPYRLN